MVFTNIHIENFRNLTEVKLDFSPSINIFYGDNGSGKTSLLEALNYLMLGRSFRSSALESLISYYQNHLCVAAQLKTCDDFVINIGIQRDQQNNLKIHLNREQLKSHMSITKLVPLQIFLAKDYRLIEHGREYRRQLMDWGVFHVEQDFLKNWQDLKKILKQRNAILKSRKIHKAELEPWDIELVKTSQVLHLQRMQYVDQLKPIFLTTLSALADGVDVELQYEAGWNINLPLENILKNNLFQDLREGVTTFGAHKTDLKFCVKNHSAKDVLSRGQQKVLIYALRLAQGMLLKQQFQKNCIYLLDDIPSELDIEKRSRIFHILNFLDAQVFITGINKNDFTDFSLKEGAKWFHVKRGNLESTHSCY